MGKTGELIVIWSVLLAAFWGGFWLGRPHPGKGQEVSREATLRQICTKAGGFFLTDLKGAMVGCNFPDIKIYCGLDGTMTTAYHDHQSRDYTTCLDGAAYLSGWVATMRRAGHQSHE